MVGKQTNTRLVVRVDLRGASPPIWRRLEIDPSLTLDQVNAVVQAAFEWTNSHLHEFSTTVPGRRWRDQRFVPPFLMDDDDDATDESTVQVGTLLANPGDLVEYMYDFGDSWDHEILVEAVGPPEPETRYPICLDGERAGPPEDSGGIWRYAYMLELMADPNNEDPEALEEFLEWMDGPFDPEAFDLKTISQRLGKLR